MSHLSFMRRLLAFFSTEYYRRHDHINRLLTGIPSEKFSRISPQLFLGGQYGKPAIEHFQRNGITGIVSMRRATPRDIDVAKNITILHLPTGDRKPPSLTDLERGVSFIRGKIDAGGGVYVHCRLGEGRGPTMAAAYLISTGMSTDEALSHLRKFRPFARPNKKQRNMLRVFEESIRSQ